MAASRTSRRTYRQIGVQLPLERKGENNNQRVIREAEVPEDDEFMNSGFLFVRALQMGPAGKIRSSGNRVKRDFSIFVVQSVATGELFVNKLLEASWDPAVSRSLPPLELRASTYRHEINDPNIDLDGIYDDDVHRNGVLPDVPFFNRLRFFQELDPDDQTDQNCTVYSLFFEFCNGGNLEQLIDKYQERGTAIPEHFIWLVIEQLFLALVAMKFGRYPIQGAGDDDGSRFGSSSDEDSNYQPDGWARIYHRDLHANNVFINYVPRGSGRAPRAGIEGNAFPEIVVGDFGNSGIEGDNTAILPVCVYPVDDDEEEDDEGFLAEWEDIYSVGEMLRKMVMAHIPESGAWDLMMRPNCGFVEDANQQPGAPPYSDELIQLLQRFEYPTQDTTVVRSLGQAIDTTFPSPEDIRDTLLPQAQARVEGFRRPANTPAGYFDSIDVSWTRPDELRPFSYIMEHAAEAGDGPDGGPPPEEEDDDSDSESGDGSDDGDGEGEGREDVEMSDSTSSEEGQDGHDDQPDDGPQQPEDPEHQGGADDDSHGDDDEDEDNDSDASSSVPPPPPPPPPTSEQLAMQQLGRMHKWNGARPRYELCSLAFGVPAISPLNRTPS